jgi:hypothetical protein
MEQFARSLGKPNGKRTFRRSVKIILKHLKNRAGGFLVVSAGSGYEPEAYCL